MQPPSKESDGIKGSSRRLGKLDASYKTSISDKRVPRTELLAATLDSVDNVLDNKVASLLGRFENIPTLGPYTVEAATKVLSASLLITGNTVGSSMFVLPEAVGGVGLINGSALFIGEKLIARSFIHVKLYWERRRICAHFSSYLLQLVNRSVFIQPHLRLLVGGCGDQITRVIRM